MSSVLTMSHFIANDVLSSPVSESAPWSISTDSFYSQSDYPQYMSPPSPQLSNATDSPVLPLKSRLSPDNSSDGEQLCMPTHQLFDLPVDSLSTSARSPSPPEERFQSPADSVGVKRSSVATICGTRKPRERINTKDFIPPDVSGLSKREARLVKNRAAAFLSRQRKREEFETMEVRVAELEQENARLLAITRGELDPIASELEQLRAKLAEAEQRSQELSAQLALKSESAPSSAVKVEAFEPQLLPSSPPSSRASPAPQYMHKTGASLGLMVLLCALPSLLSLPTQTTVPTTFSLPLSHSSLGPMSSSFDINSLISSEERSWSSSHGMDLDFDMDDAGKTSSIIFPTANSGKLELADHGSLDISFDAVSSEDGKIRVRIHPPSASGTSASSLASTPISAMSPSSDFSKPERYDPFFGVGGLDTDHYWNSDMDHRIPSSSMYEFDQDTMSGLGSSRKRVKIALKSIPSEGNEGGEWELQVY